MTSKRMTTIISCVLAGILGCAAITTALVISYGENTSKTVINKDDNIHEKEGMQRVNLATSFYNSEALKDITNYLSAIANDTKIVFDVHSINNKLETLCKDIILQQDQFKNKTSELISNIHYLLNDDEMLLDLDIVWWFGTKNNYNDTINKYYDEVEIALVNNYI